MGDSTRLKKGAWTSEEDERLSAYIKTHGPCTWSKLPLFAGLNRCGKSCRLRWMNHLRPGLKRGAFTREEVQLILNLYDKFGSRRSRSIGMICFAISSWSKIAAGLPGRSDNEIKNYWHTHLKEKSRKITRTKKAKSVPKPSRQDNVPFIILESSRETGGPLQKSPDSSPAVDSEVAITKDPVDAIPWRELPELKIMLKALDENETSWKPDSDREHMDDIRSVLDFPVSPQTSDGFSPRSIDDFIMENLATDEILMLSAPSQEHGRNDQFNIDEEVVIGKNHVTDETAMSSELDWNYWNDEFMMDEGGVPVMENVDTNQMAILSEPYLELDPVYSNEFPLLYQSLGFTF